MSYFFLFIAVSHSFGYGLMDATAMVRLAKKWRTVPEQHKCEVSAPHMNRLVHLQWIYRLSSDQYKAPIMLITHFLKTHDIKFSSIYRQIPSRSQLVLELHVKECSGVNFLEHVQVILFLSFKNLKFSPFLPKYYKKYYNVWYCLETSLLFCTNSFVHFDDIKIYKLLFLLLSTFFVVFLISSFSYDYSLRFSLPFISQRISSPHLRGKTHNITP